MGVALYLAAKAKRRGRVGGRAVSICGRVSRGRSAPQRGAGGGRRARLAGTSCCYRGIGAGPGYVRAVPGPAGQAINNRLSVQPPLLRSRYV
jgi:hypothetical protein